MKNFVGAAGKMSVTSLVTPVMSLGWCNGSCDEDLGGVVRVVNAARVVKVARVVSVVRVWLECLGCR